MIAARHSAMRRDVPARRILIALGVSLLAHFLLVGHWGGSGALHTATAVRKPLQARLELLPEVLPPPAEAEIPRLIKPLIQPITTAPPPSFPAAAPVATKLLPGGAAARGPDLRFYLARELDQYPSPLSALNLDDGRGTAGGVRLWVSIDQAGRVVDVAVVDADPPGEYERLARERVLATRFVPARRDGNLVKSRILLVMLRGS